MKKSLIKGELKGCKYYFLKKSLYFAYFHFHKTKLLMSQKSNLLLLIPAFFFLHSCQDEPEKSKDYTNIVIILTDDQGYNDLGCYGSPDIETPNIDRMAKEGIRFTDFYVAQPVCSASRAALMTGCYPNRLGIHGAFMPKAKKGLNPQETTIAEMLKPLGYSTAVFGKWHLGDHLDFSPLKQGFDEYFGIPYSNDMWPFHPQQGSVFNFGPLPLMEGEKVIDTLEDQSQLTTQITEHAVDFIKRNKEQPFFLYVPHPMPHVPLFVSDKFKGKSKRGIYGDVIMEIDWSTGQILNALKENGIDENTLVIFLSDNGPWLNYGTHSGSALPLREGKGTCFEGGVRVPAVMRWPLKITSGSISSVPAMTIDILPSIAKITGAKLPDLPIDGKNILPLILNDPNAQSPQEAYYFYYKTNELHAVRSGNYKLVLPHQYRSLNGRDGGDGGFPVDYDQNLTELALYDLSKDISEKIDINQADSLVVANLLQLAENCRSDMGDALTERIGKNNRAPGLASKQ